MILGSEINTNAFISHSIYKTHEKNISIQTYFGFVVYVYVDQVLEAVCKGTNKIEKFTHRTSFIQKNKEIRLTYVSTVEYKSLNWGTRNELVIPLKNQSVLSFKGYGFIKIKSQKNTKLINKLQTFHSSDQYHLEKQLQIYLIKGLISCIHQFEFKQYNIDHIKHEILNNVEFSRQLLHHVKLELLTFGIEIEKMIIKDIELDFVKKDTTICNSCGKRITTDQKFCSNCGSKVEVNHET